MPSHHAVFFFLKLYWLKSTPHQLFIRLKVNQNLIYKISRYSIIASKETTMAFFKNCSFITYLSFKNDNCNMSNFAVNELSE